VNFADRLLKNTPVSYFTKICPAGAKLFHSDRQTMTKLTVTFRNFANMAKINHPVEISDFRHSTVEAFALQGCHAV
jgi:hypothetical protein